TRRVVERRSRRQFRGRPQVALLAKRRPITPQRATEGRDTLPRHTAIGHPCHFSPQFDERFTCLVMVLSSFSSALQSIILIDSANPPFLSPLAQTIYSPQMTSSLVMQ